MGDGKPRAPEPVAPGTGDDSPVEVVVGKATRFSREFVATVISLVSTAFGVVAALAWNTAIQGTFSRIFQAETAGTSRGEVIAQYVYAVIVTLVGVVIIVYLGRLAARIGAQPVEFKYPGGVKKD